MAGPPPASVEELVRLGWATGTASGQLELAGEQLLAHLEAELGADDARTYLVDLALSAILLERDFGRAGAAPTEFADDRLMLAVDKFALDETAVVVGALAGLGAAPR